MTPSPLPWPRVMIVSDSTVSSYLEVARLYGETLAALDGRREAVEHSPMAKTAREWRTLVRRARGALVVQVVLGYQFRAVPGAVNVAVPFHEWSRCPSRWIEAVNEFDGVWAASHHVAGVMRRGGVTVPVRFAPPALRADGIVAKRSYVARGPFRLLFCGEPHFRKGHHLLMEGFRKAFAGNEATLTIKTSPRCPWRSPDPRIRLDIRVLSRKAMMGLYTHHDAFVSASLGEGLGLGLAEAILAGLPVAANAWSGHRSLLVSGGFFPIRHRVVDQPFCSLPELYADGQRCALSTADDIARTLRAIVSADGTERAARARVAREALVARYGPARAAARLGGVLMELARRTGTPTGSPDRSHGGAK